VGTSRKWIGYCVPWSNISKLYEWSIDREGFFLGFFSFHLFSYFATKKRQKCSGERNKNKNLHAHNPGGKVLFSSFRTRSKRSTLLAFRCHPGKRASLTPHGATPHSTRILKCFSVSGLHTAHTHVKNRLLHTHKVKQKTSEERESWLRSSSSCGQ